MGTARWERERQQREEEGRRRAEADRRRVELEHAEAEIRARMAALESELATRRAELDLLSADERHAVSRKHTDEATLRRLRSADGDLSGSE